ncbi:hypothetical protein KY366_03100 [Candidatus Woesearchaeota archaeon]|nr:hypothetical protein [Candidatus Woesearchaeota archaeon]
MIEGITQSVITMLAVINPVITGTILLQITNGLPRKDKLKAASSAALQIMVILLIVAFFGQLILEVFRISMDSFQIVGGIIIAYIGFTMLTGKMPSKADQDTFTAKASKIDLSSLIMFAASPGTIATLITISVAHRQYTYIPATALVAAGISVLITWSIMLLMVLLPSIKQGSRAKITTQYMGLILIAMGLQFALEGYKAFMLIR